MYVNIVYTSKRIRLMMIKWYLSKCVGVYLLKGILLCESADDGDE